jgi:hypothetical protein
MAIKKYTCPPQKPSGEGTFSDNLVGFQLVQGGGLTQGNFEFVESVTEKTNRNFITGVFSEPINLELLNIQSVKESAQIFEDNFKVYPNFDLSEITNFTIYGSLNKRISTSLTTIINYFPGAIECNKISLNYSTGITAFDISYNLLENETTFKLDVGRLRNPFEIDFTTQSTLNLSLRETPVSNLRNMSVEYGKYSLYYNNIGYKVNRIIPTTSLSNGVLVIFVEGKPFQNETFTYDNILIRPNDFEVNKVFNEEFDEVEKFLLNRNQTPIYTSVFNVPIENEDGTFSISKKSLTWPLTGEWNISILGDTFNTYLTELNEITENFDTYKTNLISRFLTTGAFKEFDTVDQKMDKVLQIYGRSFDETQKFISALAFMNSVNYNVGNDIPSQLLKNLALTLGWDIKMSPITSDDFLSSVFGTSNSEPSKFSGKPIPETPTELDYQYYRNIILNSAYLFKSKGTRKSIEVLMKLIGAPEAMIEFNEHVYVADQKININQFQTQLARITGGTLVEELPVLESGNTYSFQGVIYTGFTTQNVTKSVNIDIDGYPVDEEGYPSAPPETETYFFQSGSGWFEQTPDHRGTEVVNNTNNIFTGSNPNYQTSLAPYTYGQDYLDRFRDFPYMNLGFFLTQKIDNNKTWTDTEIGFRSNLDAEYNALYYTENEKLVLNVKNIDLFMNPSQAMLYDIWYMSREYNYPIPNEGYNVLPSTVLSSSNTSLRNLQPLTVTPIYPQRPIDTTVISPKPKEKTFFEFAQTFLKNMINVRDRQFSTDGKTMGYPTLESLYWKYLQSEENIGIPNNNFNYDNMLEYVNGIGDYWIRLAQQMIPGSTIWNTGVKIENTPFHRQKFAWRRQRGCQLVPVPCAPCGFISSVFPKDCPAESTECGIYPWYSNSRITSFNAVLTQTLNEYLNDGGYELNDCNLNSISSTWYVNIKIGGVTIYNQPFFSGVGYNISSSVPTNNQWLTSLILGLDYLDEIGYGYILTDKDTVVIYNQVCSISELGVDIEINIGISFNIDCSE